MKKLILTLASVFVLGFSFANASSINSINTPSVSMSSSTSLSGNDQAMIFGGEANAMVLDNEEMKNTQGFGFWSNFWDALGGTLGSGLATWGLATLLL